MTESIRIHFLGTSDGTPMLEQNCSANVFEFNGSCWMIDAGDGAESALQRQGICAADLEALLVTHWHCDHYYGAPAVLSRMRNKCAYLPVPESFGDKFSAALSVFHDVNFEARPLQFHRLVPGMELNLSHVSVKTYENAHMSPALSPELRTQFYSLSLECRTPGGKRILFSGDLGGHAYEVNFWKLLEEPADLLVLEGAHLLPLHKLLEKLHGKPIRNLIFTHIWRRGVCPEKLIAEFTAGLNIPVYAATDGDYAEFHDEKMSLHPRNELATSMRPESYFSLAERSRRFQAEGIPLRWKCIGPFPNLQRNGEYIGLNLDPENRLLADANKDCSGTYTSADGQKIGWLEMTAEELFPDGMLPMTHYFPGSDVVNYAVTDLEIARDGNYTVLWSCDAGCRMLLDGKEILFFPRKQDAVKDARSFPLPLTRGTRRLIVIQDTRKGGYGIFFRIVPDINGRK
ncbi:MAG: MBL fold metallo-hydrolase [Victivallaceae bacterium]|nr:MBL fold metallo-hydrolase [Victivallaceae bacterium]